MFDLPYDYSEAVLIDLGSAFFEYYFPKDMKGVILLNTSATMVIFNLAAYKPSSTKNTVVEQSLNIPVPAGGRFYLPMKLYSANGPLGTVGARVLELH
jgi:hypothetical protein